MNRKYPLRRVFFSGKIGTEGTRFNQGAKIGTRFNQATRKLGTRFNQDGNPV